MTMLTYVPGGVSLAIGLLTAAIWAIALLSPSRRLRRATRIRAATTPAARHQVRRNLASSLGLALLGALILISTASPPVGWLAAAAGALLVIWQLGPPLAARVRRA
jgi:Flp pilus assembly protein TadB